MHITCPVPHLGVTGVSFCIHTKWTLMKYTAYIYTFIFSRRASETCNYQGVKPQAFQVPYWKRKNKKNPNSFASLRNAEQNHSRQLKGQERHQRPKQILKLGLLEESVKLPWTACFFPFPQHFAPTAKLCDLYKSYFRGTVHKLPNRWNAGPAIALLE